MPNQITNTQPASIARQIYSSATQSSLGGTSATQRTSSLEATETSSSLQEIFNEKISDIVDEYRLSGSSLTKKFIVDKISALASSIEPSSIEKLSPDMLLNI